MKLVEFVPPVKHPLWKLCLQMGITDVIVKVNPTLTGLPDPWRYETLREIVEGLRVEGLRVVGLEGDPFDMTPIKEYGERTLLSVRESDGTDGNVRSPEELREEALEHYRELLVSMSRLGIKLLCYNFMVGPGWSRTGVRETRGGALATYFSFKETENGHSCPFEVPKRRTGTLARFDCAERRTVTLARSDSSEWRTDTLVRSDSTERRTDTLVRSDSSERTGVSVLRLDKSQVWANYEYFIKAVMPTAERVGVRMGLHPDDPCLPALGGFARIFETVADYDRAYALYPSPSNAVTFCQANFKLMLGCDAGERTLMSVRDGDSGKRTLLSVRNGDSGERTLLSVRDGDSGKRTLLSVRDGETENGHSCPFEEKDLNAQACAFSDATRALIETARHFGSRIAFIHVRDVEGDKYDFTELFHDQGTLDHFALMRTYREIGLDVPVRGDHVPEMEGDRKVVEDCIPGYFTLGRLFANGYLKALLKATRLVCG